MTRFSVDLAELAATTSDMGRFEERLLGMLAELDEAVADLHSTWSGAAAASHRAAHDRWRAGAAEMHRAGVRMREAAERAHANYRSAGEANARMWRQAR